MDWLIGVLWFALALAVVVLDRRAWRVAPAATAAVGGRAGRTLTASAGAGSAPSGFRPGLRAV